eukprot:752288-Hanusia_phi.AAC.6
MSNNFEEISGRISSRTLRQQGIDYFVVSSNGLWIDWKCRMIRTTPSMRGMKHPMAVNQQPQGGVGIVFLQARQQVSCSQLPNKNVLIECTILIRESIVDHRQDLYVHFLVENGPAHLSGVISPGEEVLYGQNDILKLTTACKAMNFVVSTQETSKRKGQT